MDDVKLDMIIAALKRVEDKLDGMLHALADDMDDDQFDLSLDGGACGRPRDPREAL